MDPDSESRPAAGSATLAGGWPRGSAALPFWLGLTAVAASRVLTRPRSLWEYDEVLFAAAVERFAPLVHHPHPPGYPLLVGLGKLFALIFGDPFTSLVALAIVSSVVGYVALVDAFRRLGARLGGDPATLAVAAALLVHLSPAMLVQGPLPMSDPPALMFVSLALAAAARLATPATPDTASRSTCGLGAALGSGAASAAAIGCRPQLAVAVLPFLAAALVVGRGGRRARLAALAAFTLVALAWFVPLLVAVGGPRGFLAYELGHAGRIAAADEATWRIGWSSAAIATRFLAHPWGLRWVSLPLLALAAFGTFRLVRLRVAAAWPLAVLTVTQLAICLAVLEPADGVRYALPTLLGIGFAAAVGAEGLLAPRLGARALWLLPAIVGLTAALYTAPLLRARARSLSPPAQAAAVARDELPRETLLLVEKTLQVHAAYLVGKNRLALPEAGLAMAAAKPQKPVWLLAEGASAWSGARVFAWPDSDAYGKLTRNHYRVVSLVPVPAARRYVVERGVFDFEFTPPEPGWRWAAPDAAVRVEPGGATRVRLRLALLADAPLPSNSITVAIGGVPAAIVGVPRGESREVVLPLPAAREVEISFRAAAGFVPAEIGYGTDRRRLAFQLVALEMLP